MRLPHNHLQISILVAFSIVSACKTRDIRTNHDAESYRDDSKNPGLALLEKVNVRPNVHVLRLDDTVFRIDGARANLQTFLNYATPTVIFTLPELADYVQILRCDENAIIYGGERMIDFVELMAKDVKTETEIFQRNNFWEAALANTNCSLVATSISDNQFEDPAAPDGRFRYYMRACVDPARMEGTADLITINCSRQVIGTNVVDNKNYRRQAETAALVASQKLQDQIHQLGRTTYQKTQLLNNQLVNCQEANQKRYLDMEQQKALTEVSAGRATDTAKDVVTGVGATVGVGASVLAAYKVKKWYNATRTTTTVSAAEFRRKIAGVANKRTAVGLIAAAAAAGMAAFAGVQIQGLFDDISKLTADISSRLPEKDPTCPEGVAYDQKTTLTEDSSASQTRGALLCDCSRALTTQNDILTATVDFYLRLDENEEMMDEAYKNSAFGTPQTNATPEASGE